MIRGKLMGIDHGLRRIGLAVSDPSGLVARELAIIKRKSNDADFARINRRAAEQHITAFVIGMPTNETPTDDGHPSQATLVQNWAERFAETTSLPVIFWDEQLSSVDAHELARQKRRQPRDPVDDLAARLILQSYLDAVRDGLAAPPPL
jgi:putative Holliday junction resolvase